MSTFNLIKRYKWLLFAFALTVLSSFTYGSHPQRARQDTLKKRKPAPEVSTMDKMPVAKPGTVEPMPVIKPKDNARMPVLRPKDTVVKRTDRRVKPKG